MNKVKIGDAFTVNGRLMRLVSIEGTNTSIKDMLTGKTHTYGLEALQRIGKQCGFKIITR